MCHNSNFLLFTLHFGEVCAREINTLSVQAIALSCTHIRIYINRLTFAHTYIRMCCTHFTSCCCLYQLHFHSACLIAVVVATRFYHCFKFVNNERGQFVKMWHVTTMLPAIFAYCIMCRLMKESAYFYHSLFVHKYILCTCGICTISSIVRTIYELPVMS